MRIGIDIDGCIRDLYSRLIQVYKRELDQNIHWIDPIEKWGVYSMSNRSSLGDDIYPFWFETHAEEIYTKALPYHGHEDVANLITRGHDLIAITDQPNPKTIGYTVNWVYKYLPISEFHVTPYKHLVKCDIYLDDASHHIKRYVDNGLDCVIMNRPWNENDKSLNGALRVNDLDGFSEHILNLWG